MVLVARTLTMSPLPAQPASKLGAFGFFHARRLALEIPQEIELGAPHAGGPNHLDLRDRGRVQREDALDALAERHLAHGERRAQTAAVHPDHDALEDLD